MATIPTPSIFACRKLIRSSISISQGNLCLARVEARRRTYGRSRPDLGEGCPERLDPAFLKWVWDYPKEREAKNQAILDEQRAEKQVIVLRNSSEIKTFLASVERNPVESLG